MLQDNVGEAVMGRAGQEHADLIGDFSLYLKSKSSGSQPS